MRSFDDSTYSAPEERLAELASIFAAAILRLRARGALLLDPGNASGLKNLPKSSQNCLEVLDETVLSGHKG